MKVKINKAKEARRLSRQLFGHLGHKVEKPKKGKGVKYNRKQKHRKNHDHNPGVFYFSTNY